MLSRLFIAGVALFLLLGAGYGATQAARYIPWNCDDWQAFAHTDRATAILESLAENRGKTLYCGIDQSDAFAKAETWEAGRDRNERDDTEYQGERGRFRGFTGPQEGWLTEGESGVTGQSTVHIFEFPREKKKKRKIKYETLPLVYGRVYTDAAGNSRYVQVVIRNGQLAYDPVARGQSHAFVSTDYGPPGATAGSQADAETNARAVFVEPTQEQINFAAKYGNPLPPKWPSNEKDRGATEECEDDLIFGGPGAEAVSVRGWLTEGSSRWNYRDGPARDSSANPQVYQSQAQVWIRYEAVCRRPR